jgi:flap endonuclease-1
MGIKGLNRFLRNTCSTHIRQVPLWELKGKTIAIDTSIYLYKFNGDGSELIDGFYHMISLFKFNGIIPLFVFDGKPPIEKYKIIERRRKNKSIAEYKYNQIKETTSNYNKNRLTQLRKQFIRVSYKDICNVKKLISLMGVNYYECKGESDGICVKLVETKVAYACMSEDMDMFVYGCNRVLRYLSLLKSTVVLYDFKGILETLNITFNEFQDICIISGTDYHEQMGDDIMNLNDALILFRKYKGYKKSDSYRNWLVKEGYIKDADAFTRVGNMFNTTIIEYPPKLIKNEYDTLGTRDFLEKNGFVFI